MDVSKNRGTPKSSHFNRVFHYKPSILGYIALFLETSKWTFAAKKNLLFSTRIAATEMGHHCDYVALARAVSASCSFLVFPRCKKIWTNTNGWQLCIQKVCWFILARLAIHVLRFPNLFVPIAYSSEFTQWFPWLPGSFRQNLPLMARAAALLAPNSSTDLVAKPTSTNSQANSRDSMERFGQVHVPLCLGGNWNKT